MATAGGAKGRSMAWLLGGIVVGVLGTVFLPRFADPYMPDGLRGAQQEVVGLVEAKSAEADRLLLTIGSEAGAMLVAYSKNVAEIDLLIDVGDSVVLVVAEYAPFMNDAKIRRVMKRRNATDTDAGAGEAAPQTITDPLAEPTLEPIAGASESLDLPVEEQGRGVEPASSDNGP